MKKPRGSACGTRLVGSYPSPANQTLAEIDNRLKFNLCERVNSLRDDVAKTGLTASGCPGRTPAPKLALVFPGERGTPFSGWSKAESALDAASGVSGWWLHDLRRTLATRLQRLGVRLEVTEAVLNHLSGSRAGVVGIYQSHDWAEEKRAALDAWSAHVLAAAEGRLPAGKVLPFSPARSGEM
jgi:integrase